MEDSNSAQIVRTWRGVVATKDLDAYTNYIRTTGIKEYRATAGNLGAWMLTRDLEQGRSEIITISRWASLDAIRAFAGDDVTAAVFYPEDNRYLLERDRTVSHYFLTT